MEQPKWLKIGMRICDALGLITLGVILFLNVTNVLDWNIWINFFKFWPVFIVLFGISIILETFELGKLISKVVGYLTFLSLILLSTSGVTLNTFDFFTFIPNYSSESMTTYSKTVNRDAEIKELNVKLENSYGSFKLENNQASKEAYFKYDSTYPKSWSAPIVSSTTNADSLNIEVSQQKKSVFNWGRSNLTLDTSAIVYDTNVPVTSYDVSIGAGENQIDLTNTYIGDFLCNIGAGQVDMTFDKLLNIDLFDLSVGAGDTEVTFEESKLKEIELGIGAGEVTLNFDETSAKDAVLNVDIGAGQAIINVPKNIGLLINTSVGLGEIDIDGDEIAGFGKKNEEYRTDNYETATIKMTITASVGVGSLEINYR